MVPAGEARHFPSPARGRMLAGTHRPGGSDMAGTGKFEDLHLDDLSLEPLPDPNVMNYQPPKAKAAAVPEKKLIQGDIRNKKGNDRRVNPERRKELRFEPDRRSGKDRRPRKTWDPARNI